MRPRGPVGLGRGVSLLSNHFLLNETYELTTKNEQPEQAQATTATMAANAATNAP